MKHTLNKIASKSNDYIICNSCKSLNWMKYKVKGRNLYDSLLEHIPGEESIKISL